MDSYRAYLAFNGKDNSVFLRKGISSSKYYDIFVPDESGTIALTKNIPSSLKCPHAISWSGYDNGSYDGSVSKSFTIPSNTSQLVNGAGFITASASITGNAGSATKLQTARSLWGNSFDGTSDITSNITISKTDSDPYIRSSQQKWFHINSNYETLLYVGDYDPYKYSGGISIKEGIVEIGKGLKTNLFVNGSFYLGASGSMYAISEIYSDSTGLNFECRTDDESNRALLPISFGWRGGSRAMTILGNGNVGIGTTTPSVKLQVDGQLKINSQISNTNGLFIVGAAKDFIIQQYDTSKFQIKSLTGGLMFFNFETGCVGIGDGNPAYKLEVGGTCRVASQFTCASNILASGGITAYSSSDIRLKINLHKADSLSLIRSLGKVYEFDYKKSGEHSIGLIAQNVQKSKLSDLVANDDEGFLKLNYWSPKLISLALGGVMQVDGKVTRLKKKVKALEKEVKLLKEELDNKNINLIN